MKISQLQYVSQQYLYEEKWPVFLYSWESFEKIFDLFITININGKETSLYFI